MATVLRENIGLLNDKLIVKVSKEDYYPSFEKKLKEYSKTANIPGFRKGMVPAGMIKKMYGAGIFSDEVLKTIEKELFTWLNAEKPEIFAQPLPLENDLGKLDMNNPTDIEFGFEIGLKPVFEIPAFSKADVTKHVVSVTDEMITEEITKMLEKGGKLVECDEISQDENIVKFTISGFDSEGNEKEMEILKQASVTFKQFSADFRKGFMGKKVGDEMLSTLANAFEPTELESVLKALEFENDNNQASETNFNITIQNISIPEKRELNEEFFNEVFPGKGIATEDELRAALKVEMEKYWEAQTLNQLQDQLYHYLLDQTKMEFPETFLKRWLQTGGDKPKTAEQAEAEFPTFSGQLKWTLISDRLITENKLDVTQDELKESMKEEVMRYFGQMSLGEDVSWLDSYIDRMMKDEKQVDATYRRLITEKVFDYATSQTTPKQKIVTADELVAMQHNHQH
jgi:trigger factor